MLPILFINLDSDGARRERMASEFSRLGLIAERFAATRWTELSETEQARYYSAELNSTQFHKPLVRGLIGDRRRCASGVNKSSVVHMRPDRPILHRLFTPWTPAHRHRRERGPFRSS